MSRLAWSTLILLAGAALAHQGEDHPAPPPATPQPFVDGGSEPAQRLPDGSLFVPKPMQRLLTLRTTLALSGKVPQTASLTGHVVAAPNAGGVVQALQTGIVLPAGGHFANLGQQVKAGDILAWLQPQVINADLAKTDADLAEARGKRQLAEQELARLTALRPHTSQQQLDVQANEIRTQLAREKALASVRDKRPLRAPIAGVISNVKVVAGQVVDAKDTLFEIIDPGRLWIEAAAFDPAILPDIGPAHATNARGEQFNLKLVGSSRSLQQQALPIQFRIEGRSPLLNLGEQVEVLLHLRRDIQGALLPAASVVRDAGGSNVIWLHIEAERFAALKVTPIPAHHGEVILQNLPANARVVVQGAQALAQIR